ncbi:putative glycoprotein [Gambie virus]|uniref:Glycoprotein n=1 Tax=Gambie virus TaxID=1903427 RepID=A0ABM6DXT4_9MONO|nr:putative glycoprotein [Gambie virus]AOR51380.1 putative glycoprotein [Gambie virus]
MSGDKHEENPPGHDSPDLYPEIESYDEPYVPISQLDNLFEKGYLPVTYLNYQTLNNNIFPYSFYMAWSMAGTYRAMKLLDPAWGPLDILSDVQIKRRDQSSFVDEFEFIASVMLNDRRAVDVFCDLCKGKPLDATLKKHYPDKGLGADCYMAPFCTTAAAAAGWVPWVGDRAATNQHATVKFFDISSFKGFKSYDVIEEARDKLDRLLGVDRDLGTLEEAVPVECVPEFMPASEKHKPSAPPPSVSSFSDNLYKPSAPQPSTSSVTNRVITNNDFQKTFIPPVRCVNAEGFFKWILHVRADPSVEACGLQKYSRYFIHEFVYSLLVQNQLPAWTAQPKIFDLVSRLNDYCIWKIKDEGLYNRDSMGTVTYVDSKGINETIQSLKTANERESRAIFNIENMLKTFINHQKSGETRYKMSDVPTVLGVKKPLFVETTVAQPEEKHETRSSGVPYIAPP